MKARLHDLAIAALDDPDAAVVLGDYVLETRWFDARVMPLINRRQYERASGRARRRAHFRAAAKGVRDWARAVLATLLFGEWPTPWGPPVMLAPSYTTVEASDEIGHIVRYQGPPPTFMPGAHPWPIMARCYVDRGMGAWFAGLHERAMGATGITLLADSNVPRGTLFGINRELAPQRLAGQNLALWTSQIDAAMAKIRRNLG